MMTKRDFFQAVSKSEKDIISLFLELLEKTKTEYCVIGGLAVNAYVEPVVSLDFDVVVAVDKRDELLAEAQKSGFDIEEFEHSINLSLSGSDLRIQIQTDTRYQDFFKRAALCDVLGYMIKVASIEDVLLGKTLAFMDNERRKSKRQKDLADIFRLVESNPDLLAKLPDEIKKLI